MTRAGIRTGGSRSDRVFREGIEGIEGVEVLEGTAGAAIAAAPDPFVSWRTKIDDLDEVYSLEHFDPVDALDLLKKKLEMIPPRP